jgi:thiamine-phosphate pyrophosphorylase
VKALNKQPLRGLYLITDEALIPQSQFSTVVEQALRGGARIIQYRDKSANNFKRLQQATELKKLCRDYHAVLIINDDIKLALQIDADGIHIGSQDTTPGDARKLLGNKIIGVSCYNRFDMAVDAAKNGADYLAFGSFFASSTKPDAVRADTPLILRAKTELHLPVCAIGGITVDNVTPLIQSGADMVAVITDILASNNIESRCKQYANLLNT